MSRDDRKTEESRAKSRALFGTGPVRTTLCLQQKGAGSVLTFEFTYEANVTEGLRHGIAEALQAAAHAAQAAYNDYVVAYAEAGGYQIEAQEVDK